MAPTTARTYITTTIPYVNARPHLGHALELVQADVLARYERGRGKLVRLQTGTDDNSLKNVLAARAAGLPVQEFVDVNAQAFGALSGQLGLCVDDVIRTSTDPRHRPGVERLWRACAAAGDLYRKHYEGLYCVGCEQFYQPAELSACAGEPGPGRCPEHGTVPEVVAEENWFFRLSRYAAPLRDAVASGRLRIEPPARRNEVLAFIGAGLDDFSVSRSVARAHGWGIGVPGDPGQVIYVWFDALANYLSALGYGTGGVNLERWWSGAASRIQVVGKGVLRFHAVYWPAMLLSARLPLPTDILVHDYLTVNGRKISKSGGNTVDPAALAAACGADAVRWWLLREVPRVGDADFSCDRLVARANDELANGIGNLAHRVAAMAGRYRDWQVGAPADPDRLASPVQRACGAADAVIASALADGDFRRATGAVYEIAVAANRYISQVRPWQLAAAERRGDREAGQRLDAVLAVLIEAAAELGTHLEPFLPATAGRIGALLAHGPGVPPREPPGQPVFARLATFRPRQSCNQV